MTESTITLNMSTIYRHMIKFYSEVINIKFEEDYFNPKDLTSETNILHLAELILGITAQCDKNEYYLEIMQEMDGEDSTELYNILLERISAFTEETKLEEFKGNLSMEDEDNKLQDNTALTSKLEASEKENNKLAEDIHNLENKITELKQTNYSLELTIKEYEAKYQELICSIENRSEAHDEDSLNVSVSIQLSELKGKLEAKDKHLQKVKEEKQSAIEEYKAKLSLLQKENLILKEENSKYEILKEKMNKFSIDEVNSYKTKIIQCERVIKEQEMKINKLKNYDADKIKLLKTIEDLTTELSLEKEKVNELHKENDYYKNMIIQSEFELKNLKKEIECYNITSPKDDSIFDTEKGKLPLIEIEKEENFKKHILELETKIKFLQIDKENLTELKNSFEEKINRLTTINEEYKAKLEKIDKKLEKYPKIKTENKSFISKISDLTDKLHQVKGENENLKFNHIKEKSEIEATYNETINNLKKQHKEELFAVKEIENENSFLKKEIKKTEDLLESNRLYVGELKKKLAGEQMEVKVDETLEKKLKDKEEVITKLESKLKVYETNFKDFTHKLEQFEKLNELMPEEIKQREEAIEFYKKQLELKEKLFNDERILFATVLHNLGLQFRVLQNNKLGQNIEL